MQLRREELFYHQDLRCCVGHYATRAVGFASISIAFPLGWTSVREASIATFTSILHGSPLNAPASRIIRFQPRLPSLHAKGFCQGWFVRVASWSPTKKKKGAPFNGIYPASPYWQIPCQCTPLNLRWGCPEWKGIKPWNTGMFGFRACPKTGAIFRFFFSSTELPPGLEDLI